MMKDPSNFQDFEQHENKDDLRLRTSQFKEILVY